MQLNQSCGKFDIVLPRNAFPCRGGIGLGEFSWARRLGRLGWIPLEFVGDKTVFRRFLHCFPQFQPQIVWIFCESNRKLSGFFADSTANCLDFLRFLLSLGGCYDSLFLLKQKIYITKYSYNQFDILEKQKNGMNKNIAPFKNNHRPECQE